MGLLGWCLLGSPNTRFLSTLGSSLWPRMTDSGCLAGVRRSGTRVSKTALRCCCVVEGKGLQEKRRVPKGWSGTEWPSLAHNSLATLGPLKQPAYHLSSPPFPNHKGAPEGELLVNLGVLGPGYIL